LSSPFLFLSIGAGALKLLLAVLGICPDPLHDYQSVLVPDLNNKTMLVPFDIKYDPVIGQEVCARIPLLDVMRRTPVLPFDVYLPRVELTPDGGMFFLVRL
jgi:hypothetical protein